MHIAGAQISHFLFQAVIFVSWRPASKGGVVIFKSLDEFSNELIFQRWNIYSLKIPKSYY